MTEINDLVAELADDVYVRGISPSQPFKPMTNNELTVEQLASINGSGLSVPDGPWICRDEDEKLGNENAEHNRKFINWANSQ